jgi:hypothetical protein
MVVCSACAGLDWVSNSGFYHLAHDASLIIIVGDLDQSDVVAYRILHYLSRGKAPVTLQPPVSQCAFNSGTRLAVPRNQIGGGWIAFHDTT